MKRLAILLLLPLLLASCFYQHADQHAWQATADSTAVARHYDVGYNFVVISDSLMLCTEIPSRAQQLAIMPDSVTVFRDDDIVVAHIDTIPEDSIDSIWVKVARDQLTQGWLRESDMLKAVSPDDPISLAINYFSGHHLQGTLLLIVLLVGYAVLKWIYDRWGKRTRQNVPATPRQPLLRRSVLFNSLYSPYPILLCLNLSGAAVLYASIQLYAPQAWQAYYFDPTLNPFASTPLIGSFLFCLWAMLVFFLATLDEVFRQLTTRRALRYLFSLITLLGILYLFFSLTTLIYIGYPLFAIYLVASIMAYYRYFRPLYRCGKCNQPLHSKGTCPHCGAENK